MWSCHESDGKSRPIIAEARVRMCAGVCGIWMKESGIWTDFALSTSVFSLSLSNDYYSLLIILDHAVFTYQWTESMNTELLRYLTTLHIP
jgi:hypothetical protein